MPGTSQFLPSCRTTGVRSMLLFRIRGRKLARPVRRGRCGVQQSSGIANL